MAHPGRKQKTDSMSEPLPPDGRNKGGRPTKYRTPEEKRAAHNYQMKKYKNKKKGILIPEPKPEDIINIETETLLDGMYQLYKKLGGSNALEKYMKEHPKEYVSMVQSLVRIEASREEAKIKRGSGEGNKGVLVVLKGLDECDPICPHCGQNVRTSPEELAASVSIDSCGEKVVVDVSNIIDPANDSILREGGDW